MSAQPKSLPLEEMVLITCDQSDEAQMHELLGEIQKLAESYVSKGSVRVYFTEDSEQG